MEFGCWVGVCCEVVVCMHDWQLKLPVPLLWPTCSSFAARSQSLFSQTSLFTLRLTDDPRAFFRGEAKKQRDPKLLQFIPCFISFPVALSDRDLTLSHSLIQTLCGICCSWCSGISDSDSISSRFSSSSSSSAKRRVNTTAAHHRKQFTWSA